MSRKNEVESATEDLDFENKKYQLQLQTSEGEICLDLYPDIAPQHCQSMIGLARIGYYDGLIFHRVISDFMIQGGCPDGNGMGGPGYNVDAEFNETPHEIGILSAARSSDPNSAGSQFFICLGTHEYLDGQYTVFGKATDASIPVVQKIGSTTTNASDRPLEDITIEKMVVTESEK